MAMTRSIKPGTAAYTASRKRLVAKKDLRALAWFAGKTDTQLENYIENNVTNLATAKDAMKLMLKLLRRVVLAIDEEAT